MKIEQKSTKKQTTTEKTEKTIKTSPLGTPFPPEIDFGSIFGPQRGTQNCPKGVRILGGNHFWSPSGGILGGWASFFRF